MNFFERLICNIINKYFWWVNPDPKPNTIDTTGMAWSDYPVRGKGWMKGWAINKRVAIIVRHANPSTQAPNNKIYFVDDLGEKHERSIIKINKDPFLLDGENKSIIRYSDPYYYMGGDTAICLLDKELPDSITTYKVSTNPKMLQKRAVTINQFKKPSTARISFKDSLAWVFAKSRDVQLIGGDSGTPWFVWDNDEWRVISHTTKGMRGEGPYYGHSLIYSEFLKRVEDIQK